MPKGERMLFMASIGREKKGGREGRQMEVGRVGLIWAVTGRCLVLENRVDAVPFLGKILI